MKRTSTQAQPVRAMAAGALVAAGALAVAPAGAGGLLRYEVGIADVALASAGCRARVLDPLTLLASPAALFLAANDYGMY